MGRVHGAGPNGDGPLESEVCEHFVTNVTKSLDPHPPFLVTGSCVTKQLLQHFALTPHPTPGVGGMLELVRIG